MPINQYCRNEWTLPHDFVGTSIDFITNLVEPILTSTCVVAAGDLLPNSPHFITGESHDEIFRKSALIDVPLSIAPICEISGLALLPILETTWEKLEEKSISLADLAVLISGGSVLDAMQEIGCVRSILDISITSSSWINSRGRVVSPKVPKSLTDAFELIRQRSALQSSPFEIRSVAELQRLAPIVGRRNLFPLNPTGLTTTLDTLGHELRLTKERVRQLESKYRLKEIVIRRWLLSDELNQLKESISSLKGLSTDLANQKLSKQFAELGPSSIKAGVTLLTAYGHSPDLIEAQGRVRSSSTFTQLPFRKSAVRQVSTDLAGPLGFVRSDDVLDTLIEMYPDADRALTLEMIQDSAGVSGLPDDYLFVRDPKRSQFTGTMHRMLGCTNPLSITELRGGLERWVSRRRLSPLPSNEVLIATLTKLEEFQVDGDEIESTAPILPKPNGNIDWMLKKIDSTGFDCIHKSQLFEDARSEGRKQSSIILHCSMYEQFITLPNGCVGRIGRVPNPALLELAAQQARLLRVETVFSYLDYGSIIEVDVVCGHSFLDGGLFGGTVSLRRQLANRTLPVFADGERHGNVSLSGAVIYGLISALVALDVKVGDSLLITFNFENDRVDVNFSQPSSDED
jgi:hypothetical protein